MTGSGKEALISLAGGDMRKVLNIMQVRSDCMVNVKL